MTTSYSPAEIWLAIVAAGLCTYGLRLSFILLLGRVDTVPPRLVGVLRYVPAAVLAALVAPAILSFSTVPSLAFQFEGPKLIAGGVAIVVAWRTESVLATIGVGMVVLWLVQYVL
ncbi:MAG: AzlD domain-containing protein [Halolamina sp.]|uniref:AzlD domain-containing protein n=1 Tax=Halolamina sp. TaxID=1940283 RepID=UPI002FC291FD